MDEAGVDRCVIIPMVPPGDDQMANNAAALAARMSQPARLAVVAPFDVGRPERSPLLKTWRSTAGMLGTRLAFLRDPNRRLLEAGELEWFWSAAEAAGVPVTVLAPGLAARLDAVAGTHPGLRLVVDHLNLHPGETYPSLAAAIAPLLPLAARPNVALKVSALPCWAPDAYPYRSLAKPIEMVLDAFGPRRVFWGSDLTRLPCTYVEWLDVVRGLPFLSTQDQEWILGRGLMEWLGWP
jgi:L-fuconolactonase